MISGGSKYLPRAAFTLPELLVSMGVMGVVLMIMFSALSTSMSLWRNNDSKIVADREARAVQLLLARDLANVVMPGTNTLWPRIATNRSGRDNVFYLKFLTAMPAGMQSANGTNVGDICYVEYAVLPSTNGPGSEVRRLFWPSEQTFRDVVQPGAFPSAPQPASEYQSLGLNLLPTNNMAARGLGPLAGEANNTNFVLLGTNMLPLAGTLSASNYPAAIEVNFSVADRTALANSNIIASSRYVIRNAGLFSFRIRLPKPPGAP
jgi:prepilin-type N-terminal cleavage/methylation domain-containing protein